MRTKGDTLHRSNNLGGSACSNYKEVVLVVNMGELGLHHGIGGGILEKNRGPSFLDSIEGRRGFSGSRTPL